MTPTSIFQQSVRGTTHQHSQPSFMMLWCCFGALEVFVLFEGKKKNVIHLEYFTIYIRYTFNTKQQHKGSLSSVLRE